MPSRRRKVLFISPSYCCAPLNGGGQRTQLFFEALKAACDVDVLIVGGANDARAASAFPGAGEIFFGVNRQPGRTLPFSLVRRFSERKVDQIATALLPTENLYRADGAMNASLEALDLSSYALIVGRYLRTTARTGVLARADAPPVLVDIDDRDDHPFEERLASPDLSFGMRMILKRHVRDIRRIMAPLVARARGLWVTSEADAPHMRHPYVAVLPNIPFHQPGDGYNLDAAAQSRTLLYVGTSGYAPNYDGVSRFLERCWPAIAAADPQARFRIVGGGWERLGALAQKTPGVELAGFCDDLTMEYENAAFCVAPVYYGGGTKIKVIEALAFGRAVVAATHAAYGFPKERIGGALTTADDDKAMIDACIALLQDPSRRMAAKQAGEALAAAGYSREGFARIVLSSCERALAGA